MQNGKTALITGASNGIGKELTRLFAKDGYNLVLVARKEDKLDQWAQEIAQEYGVETVALARDLAQEDAGQALYDEVKGRGITVNVLVNDAAVSTYGKFATETNWEREKEMIHLNILTVTQLTKLYLRDMLERNEGRILQLASLVSVTPFPLMSVYAATKSYVWNLTQSLQNEIKDSNVTMTALLPNATDTNFFNEAGAPYLNVQDTVDDPAMVARDGYKALMKGEAKVVPGGLMNKAYEVMAHLMPQETLAGMMRYNMTPKTDAKPNHNTAAWAWGIGLAAVALAGVALAVTYQNASAYDKMRYRVKAYRTKRRANGLLNDVVSAVADGWGKVKDTAENVADKATATADDVAYKVKAKEQKQAA